MRIVTEVIIIKRFMCLLLAVACAVCLFASCGESNKSSNKISIVTTIFPYYDLVRQIAGDKAELSLLISAGSEPHEYEPTPKDIVNIKSADLFIYNGGESDEWVENILSSIGDSVKVIKLFDCADLIYEQDINHIEGDEYDEHIWTSLANMSKFSDCVADELSKLDKDNSEYYSKNSESYNASLEKLENDFASMVDNSAKKTVVIADRFPLLYLFTEFGIKCESAFPGCTSETQPSPKTVSKLINFVKNNGIDVVFKIDNSSDSLGKTILDGEVKTLYSLHNVTKEQFDSGETYISLMELNLNALKEALG